jgi:hypothetical protein
MFYLVDGQIKRKVETIVDVQRYDLNCAYFLEFIRFSDGTIACEDFCFELSLRNILAWLRMRRTKLLMRFNSLVFSKKNKEIDSIF